MARLIVTASAGRKRRPVELVIPANEALSTTLYISESMRQVPTLVSLESVLGRLSGLGLVIQGPADLDTLARALNTGFMTVPIAEWRDVSVSVSTQQLEPADLPVLGVVQEVREPTLDAALKILKAESRKDAGQRREHEDALVQQVNGAVRQSEDVWRGNWKKAMDIVGLTVLTTLTQSLLAVPLVDVIQQALGGVSRRV